MLLTRRFLIVLLGCLFLVGMVIPDYSNAADLTVGQIVTDSKDQKLVFGGCDEDPYATLQREGFIAPSAIVVPQRNGNTLENGIDSGLACRLLKFFRATKACSPRITSAFRSKQQQCDACRKICGNCGGCQGTGRGCAPPGSSCHQYGRAVDIESRCAEQMSAAARNYGLISRIPGYPNPNHYQCLEHGRSAGISSCNTSCQGGLSITPGPEDFRPSGPPSSSIANALRGFINPPPQPPPQQPQQALPASQQPQLQQQPPPIGTVPNTTPSTPGTCAPQFYCKDNTYYYRSSSCVDQAYKQCTNGCSASGGGCASGSSTSSLSAFDQISALLEPVSSQLTGTTTPFVLTIGGEPVATIQQPNPSETGNVTPTGNSYVPLSVSQQTFTSGDLRNSPVSSYAPQQLTGFQQTLNAMKERLLRLLAYLRPFGRPTSVENIYHYGE